jgi:hypothetical protein
MIEATTSRALAETELDEFVQAGDPKSAEGPAWLTLAPKEKADLLMQVREHIAMVRAALKPHEDTERAIFLAIQADMIERKATVVAHPELDIKLEAKTEKQVLAPELLTGLTDLVVKGEIEKADADKAAWLFQPEPEIKTHLSRIKDLAKKYGTTVEPLLAETVRELPPTYKLSITPKKTAEKNVTPVVDLEATYHAD